VDNDVDVLLDELRAAGGVDLEGRFSVDAGAAREKLARFQLPHPAMWPLPFVSAAVWAGATKMSLRSSGGRWTVEWNGDPIEVGKIEAGETPALEALRAAIEIVRVLRPDRVTVSSGERQLELRQGRAALLDCRRVSGTRVVIEQGDSWGRLKRFLFESVDGIDEASVLASAAEHAPLDLTVHGASIGRPVGGLVDALAVRLVEPLRPLPASGFRHVQPRHLERIEADVPFRALLWVHDVAFEAQTLTVIAAGLSFAADPSLLGHRRISCVVAAPFVEKDLSHSKLIQDEAFQALVDALRAQARELLLSVAEGAMAGDAMLLLDLVESVGPSFMDDLNPLDLWRSVVQVGREAVRRGAFDLASKAAVRLADLVEMDSPRLSEAEQAVALLRPELEHAVLAGRCAAVHLERCVEALGRLRRRLGERSSAAAAVGQTRQQRAADRLSAVIALQGAAGRAISFLPEPQDELARFHRELRISMFERLAGRLDIAFSMLESLAARPPDASPLLRATALQQLAETALARKDPERAAHSCLQASNELAATAPFLRIALCEVRAEALAQVGRAEEAAALLCQALDLRVEHPAQDEDALTLCARQWRRRATEAGMDPDAATGFFTRIQRRVTDLWRREEDRTARNVALSRRALSNPRLQRVLELWEIQPYTAVAALQELMRDTIGSGGLGSPHAPPMLRLGVILYRSVWEARAADECQVRLHLLEALRGADISMGV
jgi:tetratricopeptide (TPR) repeat protein